MGVSESGESERGESEGESEREWGEWVGESE